MKKMDHKWHIICWFSWWLLKTTTAFLSSDFNSSNPENVLMLLNQTETNVSSTVTDSKQFVEWEEDYGDWHAFNSSEELKDFISNSSLIKNIVVYYPEMGLVRYPTINDTLNYHHSLASYYSFTASDDHLLRNMIVLAGYVLIILVSLGGNILVCHVIYSTPRLRTTTNLLIFSLTVSDIMTTVLNIPFNCARIMVHQWPFPDSFCILMPTVQVTSVYVSTLTMAAIGVHRYRSVRIPRITKPLCRLSSSLECAPYGTPKAKIILWICVLWIISLLLSVPHSVFNQVIMTVHDELLVRRCVAIYPTSVENRMPLWLSIEVTLTQFIIPLSITVTLYFRIAKIIQRQGQIAQHFCDELNRRICEAKRKRIMMLILVVLAFILSWFPLTAYHMLNDLHMVPFHYTTFFALHLIAMSSVCYNPLIYCGMNEDFRARVKQVLRSSPLARLLKAFRKRTSRQASLTSLSNAATYAVTSEGLRETGPVNNPSETLETAITILSSSDSSSTSSNPKRVITSDL